VKPFSGDSTEAVRPVQPEGGGSIPASPLQLAPIFQKDAKKFIARHHRHNIPSIASIFNIGIECEGELIGVAMVGLPKARKLMDGRTLEVTRVCIREGIPNANSMLYGACARAAQSLGWSELITYTLPSESGASLKAAGWKMDAGEYGGNVAAWNSERNRHNSATDMFGAQRIPDGAKLRWRRRLR
jgi:hypothetical protein